MNSDFLIELFVSLTILVATGLIAWWAMDVNCTQKWKDTGYESKYELLAGCKVRKEGATNWFPASNLREEAK